MQSARLLLMIVQSGIASLAYAQDSLSEKQKALVIIADFADRVCAVAPLDGARTQVSLTRSVTSELGGLIDKLMRLGGTEAAKYESSTYRGVLQEQLANALADANRCKLKVFSDLSDKLLPTAEKGCRTPEHGIEYWGHTASWTADSGWRRGGASPLEYCGARKVDRERKFQDRSVILVNTGESHKTQRKPFKKDFYRYTCAFEDRWQPIYRFADTAACHR